MRTASWETAQRQQEAQRRYAHARAEIESLTVEIRALNAKADAENRGLSSREQERYETLMSKLTRANRSRDDALAEGAFHPGLTSGVPLWQQRDDDAVGRPDLLRPEERMADWVDERAGVRMSDGMRSELDDPSRFSLGRAVRSWMTGDWADAEVERRSLVEGTNSAGGFLLPAPLSARVIDRVRAKMRVMQSGAVVVPMTTVTLALPRLTGDPTPEWHAESGSVTASTETFDRVTFNAKTVDCLVRMSVELFEDVPAESAALIEDAIVTAVALEIDRVALRGDGTSNAPTGVLHQSGTTLTSLGAAGASPTYDNLVDGVSTIRIANLEPTSMILAPRTEQSLAKLKDSQGRYLEPPSSIAGIPRLSTNQVPTNLDSSNAANHDCSEIYIAQWDQLLIGWRTGIGMGMVQPSTVIGDTAQVGQFANPSVRVLRERFADVLEVGLLTYSRLDVQLQHAAAFVVLTGVRP